VEGNVHSDVSTNAFKSVPYLTIIKGDYFGCLSSHFRREERYTSIGFSTINILRYSDYRRLATDMKDNMKIGLISQHLPVLPVTALFRGISDTNAL